MGGGGTGEVHLRSRSCPSQLDVAAPLLPSSPTSSADVALPLQSCSRAVSRLIVVATAVSVSICADGEIRERSVAILLPSVQCKLQPVALTADVLQVLKSCVTP